MQKFKALQAEAVPASVPSDYCMFPLIVAG